MKTLLLLAALLLPALNCAAGDLGYDPLVDPFQQLKESSVKAKEEGKYILVISGGDWCRWCHVLEDYLHSNDEVYEKLLRTFVIVKVYFGEKNLNEKFFSKLPKSNVAPHFWVINSDGEVLLSQNASVFEKGKKGYSDDVFNQFIDAIEKYKSSKG